jgi:hypothetical protein
VVVVGGVVVEVVDVVVGGVVVVVGSAWALLQPVTPMASAQTSMGIVEGRTRSDLSEFRRLSFRPVVDPDYPAADSGTRSLKRQGDVCAGCDRRMRPRRQRPGS